MNTFFFMFPSYIWIDIGRSCLKCSFIFLFLYNCNENRCSVCFESIRIRVKLSVLQLTIFSVIQHRPYSHVMSFWKLHCYTINNLISLKGIILVCLKYRKPSENKWNLCLFKVIFRSQHYSHYPHFMVTFYIYISRLSHFPESQSNHSRRVETFRMRRVSRTIWKSEIGSIFFLNVKPIRWW